MNRLLIKLPEMPVNYLIRVIRMPAIIEIAGVCLTISSVTCRMGDGSVSPRLPYPIRISGRALL